jgi:hypothetical protein
MLKFKDRSTDRNGLVRYKAYRNGQLIESFWPNNEDYKCKDNQICQGTQGDERWSKFISKEAIDFINYELVEKKKKPLTPSEERQVFDFYFNGDTLGLKEEIKKHREEIKKLKEKLKNG